METSVNRSELRQSLSFITDKIKENIINDVAVIIDETQTPSNKTKTLSAQEMINMAYKGTGNNWDKASKNAMDMYGTTLTELISKRGSSKSKTKSTSDFTEIENVGVFQGDPEKEDFGAMSRNPLPKKSPTKKAKGSRGYKMKKNR